MRPLVLNFYWEEAPDAVTLRPIPAKRRRAREFNDAPAGATARQAAFYRNLVRMAEQLRSRILPIDVIPHGEQEPKTLDAGCIKIASLAGFIQLLDDGPTGAVEEIRLNWDPE